MNNTDFVLEYAGSLAFHDYLAPSYYLIVKNFSNSKGYCEVPPSWIAEHLGLDERRHKEILDYMIASNYLSKQGEVLQLTLNNSKRIIGSKTRLDKYAYEEIPQGYNALFDEKQLYNCYVTNGNVLWKVLAEVSRFLNLDFLVVKRLLEIPENRAKFVEIRRKVEAAAEMAGQKVTKRKLKKQSEKTVTELVEQLMTEVHIRNEQEIPKEEWKSPQLLRLYCLLYKQTYNQEFVFTANPFGGMEMRDMKGIHDAFDTNSVEAIAFLEWCFNVKAKDGNVKYPLTPRFCVHANVIREFKTGGRSFAKPAGAVKLERKSPIPTEFIEWIVANHPTLQETYQFSTMEQLQWMKKAYDENDLPHPDLKAVVEHGIEIRLIPATGEFPFA